MIARFCSYTLILLTAVAWPVMAAVPEAKSSAAKAKTTATPADTDAEDEDHIHEGPDPKGLKPIAAVSTIDPEDLAGFEHYAPQIQQLIRDALDLTKLNLTYTFGSADPKLGGMDCSGAIFHLLQGLGMKSVPRQSDEICGWVADRTLLHRVTTAKTLSDPEFSALQPGDLLFWSGTYSTTARKIPVSHVMLYLGKLKKSGKQVVFGSSDGRVYAGQRRTGVSVFDFSLPKAGAKASFYGYGLIPAIGKVEVKPPAPLPAVAELMGPPKPDEKTASAVAAAEKKPPPPAVEAEPETAAPKEEIRKAAAASLSRKTAAEGPKPKSKATTPPKKKSPSSASPATKARSKPKTTASKKSPPSPLQRMEAATNRLADTLRKAAGN